MEILVITTVVLIFITIEGLAILKEKGITLGDVLNSFKPKTEFQKSLYLQVKIREEINQTERNIQNKEFEIAKSELEKKFLTDKLISLQGKLLLIRQEQEKREIENG